MPVQHGWPNFVISMIVCYLSAREVAYIVRGMDVENRVPEQLD